MQEEIEGIPVSKILAEVRQILGLHSINQSVVSIGAGPLPRLDRRSPVVIPMRQPPMRQVSCSSLATSVGTNTDPDLYLDDDDSDYAASITYYTLEDSQQL